MKIGNYLANNYQYINQISIAKSNLEKSYEKLSTGKAVNRGADNPSMMLTISRFESQIRGSQAAQNNIQDGIAFLDTKDKALEMVQELGKELRDMAVKYNNEFLSDEERAAMIYNATEILKEIDNVFKTTEFKGRNVFDSDEITIQTGPNASDLYTIKQSEKTLVREGSIRPMASGVETNNIETENVEETVQAATFGTQSDGKNNGSGTIQTNQVDLDSLRMGVPRPEVNINDILGLGSIVGGVIDLVGGLLGLGGKGKGKGNGSGNGGNSNQPTPPQNPPQNPPTTPPTNDPTPPIQDDDKGIGNGGISPIEQFLNPDIIDEQLLNPIAAQRSTTGVQRNILESRLEYQRGMNQIQQKSLAQIQDVDVAKEYLNIAKNEMLLNTNFVLLHESLNDRRGGLMSLLY